ncbi:MAG: hypothetical protein IPI60_09295 [Saprospiraceae bacterium]|nr:hypothetical protein [Saprospiraceae bacterium]
MNTKLTLTIEEEVIQRAKAYAKEKESSLSEIVENYLKSLTNKTKNQKSKISTPVVKALRGSFKAPADFDYETELYKALEKKYL